MDVTRSSLTSIVTIRKCVPGDENALALVGQASFLEAFAGSIGGSDITAHCLREHSDEKYRAWLRDDASTIWIAEVGGAPVGYLVLTAPDLPLPHIGPTDFEIKRVYLLHRFQGSGAGRRLMDEARRYAEQHDARRLLLGVYEANATARTFYERLGYVRVGERSFTVGANTYRDFIYALALRR